LLVAGVLLYHYYPETVTRLGGAFIHVAKAR
jgi:hypothetical protein